MKILHTVEFYQPITSGMTEVVTQLSERLVAQGHKVVVATTRHSSRTKLNYNGVEVVEFDINGNFVRGLNGEVERYRDFLINNDFDIITNFAAQQWATDIALPILPLIKARKVFVPTGFSGFYDPAYGTYFERMKEWMKSYDMSLFLSDDYRDINFARANNIKNTMLIPNGADEREFLVQSKIDIRSQLGVPKKNFLIISVGSHTGRKGHVEAIEMFKKAQITNATLLIVGNSFGAGCTDYCNHAPEKFNSDSAMQAQGKQLIITSIPRAETVAAYQAADLFLFPSNIECSPIVLFEAMASKTPFLSTDVGNSAEIAKWGEGGLILPTRKDNDQGEVTAEIDGSARMLSALVNDKPRLKTLADKGYKAWLDRFTWDKIARNYETLYKQLLQKPSSYKKQIVGKGIDAVIYDQNDPASLHATLAALNMQTYKPAKTLIATAEKIPLNNLKKEYPALNVEHVVVSTAEFTEVAKAALPQLGGKVLFISSLPTFDKFYIEEATRLIDAGSSAVLIYPNYHTMQANKPLTDRFSSQELSFEFFGSEIGRLIATNKIHATFDASIVDVARLKQVIEPSSGLKHYAQWDLWLQLVVGNSYDYIFVYTPLLGIKSYLESYLREDRSYLDDQIHLYNIWMQKLKTPLKSWANFLCWRLIYQFWNRDSLTLVNKNLTDVSKKYLFVLTGGSFKAYLFIYVVFHFAKILKLLSRDTFVHTKVNLRRLFQVTKL